LRVVAREKLEIVLFASASMRGGRKGGLVFALPPAEQIARKISSDFFKYTPPKKSFVYNFLFVRARFFLLKGKQNFSLAACS